MPNPLNAIGKFFENVAQGTQDGLEELQKNFDKISSSTLNFFQKAFEMGGALGKDFLASLNPAESMKWMGTYFLKSEVSNRKIAGTNQQRTDSWSFASSINYNNTNDKSKHNAFFGLKDTGAHLSFTLKRGRVHWTINGKIPKSGSLFGSTKAISYNKKRKGQEINLPLFDMIASSSDRIIAKVKDKDRYFMAIPTELYYHKTKAGKFITLPQSLFKFDPEIHREGRNTKDIIDSMNIKDDDFAHPATIRFQFFKSVFKTLNDPLPKLIFFAFFLQAFALFISTFALKNRKFYLQHILDQIPVIIPSFTWVEIDTRPFLQSKPFTDAFKKRYKLYDHVTYRQKVGPAEIPGFKEVRQSIDYKKVLSLGVGLSHLHEQYEPIYGGEIDALQNNDLILDKSHDHWYRFANGQFRDAGGWIDGTCIYYLLVQNKETKDLPRDFDAPNKDWRNAYSVLWADEQFGFTERWRSAEIQDSEFMTPLSIYHVINHGHHPLKPNLNSFFSPFAAGRIRTFSRMTVARQIIVVNGYNSDNKQHDLYTYHLAWGNMDKTWRKRVLDFTPTTRNKHNFQATQSYIIPNRVNIREDMTISIDGGKIINGKLVKGYWLQKYLPSDNVERQIYNHHWDFLSADAFNFRHENFSHFGVLKDVSSRIQFYQVKFKSLADENIAKSNYGKSFIDKKNEFITQHDVLSWSGAGHWLGAVSGEALLEVLKGILQGVVDIFTNPSKSFNDFIGFFGEKGLTKKRKRPIYSKYFRIKLSPAGHLGTIATYYDKREDKNVGLQLITKKNFKIVKLSLEGSEKKEKVNLSLIQRWANFPGFPEPKKCPMSPPEVEFVTLNIKEKDNDFLLQFSLGCSRSSFIGNMDTFDDSIAHKLIKEKLLKSEFDYKTWLKANLYKLHLGIRKRNNRPFILTYELHDYIDSGGVFNTKNYEHNKLNQNLFIFNVNVPVGKVMGKILQHHLSEHNRVMKGHSIWFEGVTGLVNIASKTIFEERFPLNFGN